MRDNVFSVPSGKDYIRFTHLCPFATMRMVDLPRPQRYTREEYYWATPPDIMEKSGFHHKDSLTVYQGLVYQLLQLHSSYHRPYADPVHDPTWRWWKNQKEEAEYFNYKASNWKSLGGIYVDMANYAKIYNLMPDNNLPQFIYLDKNTAYSFNVFLTTRSARESMGETTEENSLNNIWLTVILTHPEYVTIRDNGNYPQQELSGKNLLKSSASIKGTDTLEIHIGCPPGKRLAFDITYTKNYTTEKNKRYFDLFYPFFLIQDMVTGDSGRFHGRWICQKDSPCYDIVPQSMATPDYFFVIKVSNRGVKSCQNARESFFLRISMAVVVGLVILYILVDIMAPRVKEFCNKTLKRLEDAIAFRAESSLTFSSSFSSQGSLQHLHSSISSGELA
ncbi:Cation channel sperm-associated protein subunit gamma, partial [Ophiophagus hannah]